MNDNQVITLLTLTLISMIFILLTLIGIYIWIKMKTKKDEQLSKGIITSGNKEQHEVKKEYNKQSIFKFMEFDSIRDNMIVQKDGKRFLMIIECQGINFDLMSGLEKNSVEQGFLQFLNTSLKSVTMLVSKFATFNETRLSNPEKRPENDFAGPVFNF